jgi:hypothetical protein
VYKNYIPSFQGHYLSSNINITLPNSPKNASVPYGNRYLHFQTKNQKLNITAFGVLFGFDRAADGLKVQSVLEMMQEGWWREVMEGSNNTDVFVLREFRVCSLSLASIDFILSRLTWMRLYYL